MSRPVANCCQHGNEESVAIKCGEFHDRMSVYQALLKGSSPCYVLISWHLHIVSVRFFLMRRAELFGAAGATLVDKIYRCVRGTVFITERYWLVSRAVSLFRILSAIRSVMLSPDFLLGIQLNLYVHFPGVVVSLFYCTRLQPVGSLTLIPIFIQVTALPPCFITATEMLVVGKSWNL
jgi:hypothetical protein